MLKFCFMVYDKDRSGLMEMEELHHFIRASLNAPSEREITSYKLREVFASECAVYGVRQKALPIIFVIGATC